MKKLIVFVLAVISILSLAGCKEVQTDNYTVPTDVTSQKENVLKAWTGDFSEEKLINAINEYQNHYDTIVCDDVSFKEVSFEADFEVVSCSVARLSSVDNEDIEVELYSYIDLSVQTLCSGNKVTVPIDWWHSGNKVEPVWSYLVCARDAEGAKHYYYFRTDYSAFMGIKKMCKGQADSNI